MAVHPSTAPTRYLVVTTGTAGDIFPFLALAQAMQTQGLDVQFASNPVYAGLVESVDLPFVPFGSAEIHHLSVADPELWHARKGFAVVMNALAAQSHPSAITELARQLSPDHRHVVICHSLLVGVIDMLRGLRPDTLAIACHLSPSALRSVHDPLAFAPVRTPEWIPAGWRDGLWRRLDERVVDPAIVPSLNASRAALGLAPIHHFFEHCRAAADHHIALFPAWFCPPMPDWPHLLAQGEFPLYDPQGEVGSPIRLTQFLSEGPAPVVFMPGSNFRHGQVFFARALEAVQALGLRALILTTHRAQLPEQLPDTVLWQPYVPLHDVLRHASAIVHHGGIGTTAEAFAAGVPQLVIPLAFDQFRNAMRVQQLGVGRALADAAWQPESVIRAGRLRRALKAVLTSAPLRERCAELAWRHFDHAPDCAHVVDAIVAAVEVDAVSPACA